VGALLLAVSIKTSAVGEDELTWSDPLIAGLFGASGGLFLVFMLVETKVAREPVLPLELLHRRTAVSVAIHNLVVSMLIYAVVSRSESWIEPKLTRSAVQCPSILYGSEPHVGLDSRKPLDPQRFLCGRSLAWIGIARPCYRQILLVDIHLGGMWDR
jgi:hypothetical protein